MFSVVGGLLGSCGRCYVKLTAKLPGSDSLWRDVVVLEVGFESLNNDLLGWQVKGGEGGDEMVWELDGEGRHGECGDCYFPDYRRRYQV